MSHEEGKRKFRSSLVVHPHEDCFHRIGQVSVEYWNDSERRRIERRRKRAVRPDVRTRFACCRSLGNTCLTTNGPHGRDYLSLESCTPNVAQLLPLLSRPTCVALPTYDPISACACAPRDQYRFTYLSPRGGRYDRRKAQLSLGTASNAPTNGRFEYYGQTSASLTTDEIQGSLSLYGNFHRRIFVLLFVLFNLLRFSFFLLSYKIRKYFLSRDS